VPVAKRLYLSQDLAGRVVVLDGVRYTARAAWPADEIEGNEPSVELEFSPPLPVMP
jgi:hypothetical protein